MIAKKLLIAFVALAAALPLTNINAAAAGSATSPLYGPYVLTGKMVCGAGSSSPNGMGGLSTSNAAFSVDTADSYQTWLSARSLPNPAGQTHYNSLGFNSSATVPETPVQWGRMDKFGIGSIKSWGFNPGAPNPWVDQGPNFFLVTSYPFPLRLTPTLRVIFFIYTIRLLAKRRAGINFRLPSTIRDPSPLLFRQ
jgi:hypothetical protein